MYKNYKQQNTSTITFNPPEKNASIHDRQNNRKRNQVSEMEVQQIEITQDNKQKFLQEFEEIYK